MKIGLFLVGASAFCVIRAFLILPVVEALGTHTVYASATSGPEIVVVPSIVRPGPSIKAVAASSVKKGSLPSQSQKDDVAAVCKSSAVSNTSYKSYGVSESLFISTCTSDLLSIAFVESRYDCSVKGDWLNGAPRSFGCYQIQTKLHKVSVEQAQDFKWAANWTLQRLIANGYVRYRSWALGSHNSFTPVVNARYSAMVKETSARLSMAGL